MNEEERKNGRRKTGCDFVPKIQKRPLYFITVTQLLAELIHDTDTMTFLSKLGQLVSLWDDVHDRKADGSSVSPMNLIYKNKGKYSSTMLDHYVMVTQRGVMGVSPLTYDIHLGQVTRLHGVGIQATE
jgi:hypothetical protein